MNPFGTILLLGITKNPMGRGAAMVGDVVFIICLLTGCGVNNVVVFAKDCTNIPQAQSHTIMYQVSSTNNQTLKNQIMSLYKTHHHFEQHVNPSDDSAWASLFPRKMKLMHMEEESSSARWQAVYKQMKHPDVFAEASNFLKEVSLHKVRLEPGPRPGGSIHWRAQQTNMQYLMMLDPESMAWNFRKTAGLPTPGTPYGGWEAPNCELRGHFVGHYLSATAQMWASTHNEKLKQNMDALVSSLKQCQDKIGNGYLSAFPSELFDRFEAIKPVWAPYYTIHKIMAGLLDQHTLADNAVALKMLTWMVDYFYKRVQNVIIKYSIERHYYSLNTEVGGMNDVLYRLYTITGDQKHLLLAHLFDKPCFLGILAVKADDISGYHANTHIPLVVGAQMRYEITGDELYKEMGTFFLDIVNSTHTYATGGTSFHEFWQPPLRLAAQLGVETEESCTTYNMLKVSRNLFRWTKEAAYADYYERAFTNGVLSIQRGTDPGVMIYMLPLGHGVSKSESHHGWGNSTEAFWCCYGTGIESFSKLGDSIYFEESGKNPGLYVIQYISSSLDWESGNISLIQKVENVVSWDQRLQTTITVTPKQGARKSTLKFRIPSWTSLNGASAILNGKKLELPAPGNFLQVGRNWKSGDKISLVFPLILRTETILDDRQNFTSLKAILYGPYLLAGISKGDFDLKTGSVKSISDWVSPIPPAQNSQLISLIQGAGNTRLYLSRNNDQSITMEPPSIPGKNSSIHATFRIILKNQQTPRDPQKNLTVEDVIGQTVSLEPFDFPGSVVASNGEGQGLSIVTSPGAGGNNRSGSFEFLVVEGLDGKNGTISMQLKSRKGCFVFGGSKPGEAAKLSCNSRLQEGFQRLGSFEWAKGSREYHPMGFIARGQRRSYVIEPLLSMRDEFYNVYFDIVI